ncbi:MAG: ComF family protein [Candidatus Paceibacteria bacterium]|jgi:ComF family protein
MIRLSSIIDIIFPSRYSYNEVVNIPKAPACEIPNVFPLFDYHSSSGKKLVYGIKKHRDRILSRHIATYMAEHMQEYLSEQQQFSFFLAPLIIPVPITKKQEHKRGFNQSENIARYFAQSIDGIYSRNLVIKSRETQKQALLTKRTERFINVQNCFSIAAKYKGQLDHQDIIIIDDLVTTGATIRSLEKTLRAAGARNVIAITVGH